MKNCWRETKFVAAAIGMTFLTGSACAAVQTLTWSGTITDPINLPEGDTVVNWTEGVSVEGKISGPGRLILAAAADATGRLELNNAANDFSGGIVVQYGLVLLKPGAQGMGTICNTNETFDGRVFNTYNRPQIVIKAPTELANEIRLGSENAVNFARRLSVTGTGDVVFNGSIIGTGGPSFGSATVDDVGFSGIVTFRGGIADPYRFVMNGVDCRIEATPMNVPTLFCGMKEVTFAVSGNTVGSLNGWGNGKFVIDTDNAFANTPNFEGQDSNRSGVILDVNGHDVILGGHQGSDGWKTAPFSIENGDASKMPSVTITQTKDNVSSCLLTKGPMTFVKAGDAALTLVNDAIAFVGSLSVTDGTLTLGFGEVAAKGDLPDVGLTGGTLDLGGRTWTCPTFAMTGGRLCNGLLVPSTTSTVSGGEIRGGSLGGNWTKTGAGSVTVDAFSTTGCWHETSYALADDAVLFWSFDDVTAPWTENRVGGHTLEKVVNGGSVLEQTAEGKYWRGVSLDPRGEWSGSSFKLSNFPSEMPVDANSATISIWFKLDQSVIDDVKTRTDVRTDYALWCYGEHGTADSHTRMRGLNSMALLYSGGEWKLHNYLNYYDAQDQNSTHFCQRRIGDLDAAWHNVTVVLDDAGDTYTLYYDGVQQDDVMPLGGMRPRAGVFKIGAAEYNGSWWGELDEFLVLNTARSADDVKALYDEGVARQAARFDERVTVNLTDGTINEPTDSLFHFTFDDTDRPFADVSVNAQTATVYGQPKQDAGGRFGNCVRLNGDNEYLEIPYPQNLPRGGGAFTVSFWFNMDTDWVTEEGVGYGFFGIGCSPTTGDSQYMSYEAKILGSGEQPTDSSWCVYGYGESSLGYPTWKPDAPAKIMDGEWHHVVYTVDTTRDGDNTHLYVDGVLRGSKSSTGFAWDLNGSILIGKSVWNWFTFKGRLDDVVGWARQLSANEVTALYQAAAPSVPSLTVGEKMTLAVAADVDVYGGLTFADGATLNGGNGALGLKGADLSFNGSGTLALAANPEMTWVTVATDVGAISATSLANFRTWTVTWPGGSLPLTAANKVVFADGRLRIRLCRPGSVLIFR